MFSAHKETQAVENDIVAAAVERPVTNRDERDESVLNETMLNERFRFGTD